MTRRNFFSATFGALFATAAAVVGAKVPDTGWSRFKPLKAYRGSTHVLIEGATLSRATVRDEYTFNFARKTFEGEFLHIMADSHAFAKVIFCHSLSGKREEFILDCYDFGNMIPRTLSVEEFEARNGIILDGDGVWSASAEDAAAMQRDKALDEARDALNKLIGQMKPLPQV